MYYQGRFCLVQYDENLKIYIYRLYFLHKFHFLFNLAYFLLIEYVLCRLFVFLTLIFKLYC